MAKKYLGGNDKYRRTSNKGHNNEQATIFDYIDPEDEGLPTPYEDKTSYAPVDTEAFTDLLKQYNIPEDDIDTALSYYMTTQPHTNGELRRDNALLHAVLVPLLRLQHRKEGTYGDSWAKRGELEVFFNASRKFDRLENIMLNDALDEVGESYVDTVADLANYALLWLTYVAREKPELFDKWLTETYK